MVLKRENLKPLYIEISVFMITFLIHIFFICGMRAPQYVDEYRTFLTGEFLTGRYDLSLLHAYEEANMYYGFGQVLFYIPFFWIFKSINTVFKAALIFNGIVMSLVPVLALKIFRTLLPEYSELQRAGMAFATGMFSPLIYASKTVTNETFLLFFPVLILYLIVVLSMNEDTKKKLVLSALLGLCSAWMYTLNARGMAIVFSVFICVVYMEIIRKQKKISILSYMVSSIAVFVLNYFLNKIIIRNFHQPFSGTVIRNSDIGLMNRIKQIYSGDFFTAIAAWCGNWFYMLVVSGGLIALLVVVMKKRKQKMESNILAYALTNTFITSAMLFFINYETYSHPKKLNIDYYIYGRYYDLLIPVILIVGIYFLIRYGSYYKTYLAAMFVAVCSGIIVSVFFARILIETESSGIRILNIGTLTAFLGYSFIENPSYAYFWGLSIAVLIIYSILTWLGKRKKLMIIAVLFSGCFLFASLYVMKSCKNASANSMANLEAYQNMFSEYEGMDENYKKVYYLYEEGTFRGVNIQYALRGWQIAQIDIKSDHNRNLNMVEKNSFILTQREMFLDLLYEDCELIKEENGTFLYVYGQELMQELNVEAKGRDIVPLESLLKVNEEMSALYIVKGAQSYGPYLNLEEGTYYVEINGKNLGTASISVTKNCANDLVENGITDQTEEKLCLWFFSDSSMNDVEISIYNTDRSYVVVDDIIINNGRKEQIFAENGRNLYVTIPAYFINSINENIHLNLAMLNQGKYLLTLEGMNANYLKLSSDELQGDIKEFESGKNYIVYELNCETFTKYPKILLESKTGELIHIENVIIERRDNE